jgi:hypothetical protein
LTSFDELIYNKEVTGGGSKNKMHREFSNHPQEVNIMPIIDQQQQQQMLLPLVPVTSQQQQPMNGGGGGGLRRMSPNGVNNQQYSNQQLYNETTFTTPGGETNRQILLTHGDTQNVVAKLQQQKLQQVKGDKLLS